MEDVVLLGVGAGTTGIALAILGYIKHMKQKSRKHVLRNEEIRRYFK